MRKPLLCMSRKSGGAGLIPGTGIFQKDISLSVKITFLISYFFPDAGMNPIYR